MTDMTAEIQVIVNESLKGYVSKEECEKAQAACQKVNCLELKIVKNDVGTVKKLSWTILGIFLALAGGAIWFFIALAQEILRKAV